MKLKALLLALFTAGFAVSVAVAASPATVDKGNADDEHLDRRLDHVRVARQGQGSREGCCVQAREKDRRHR